MLVGRGNNKAETQAERETSAEHLLDSCLGGCQHILPRSGVKAPRAILGNCFLSAFYSRSPSLHRVFGFGSHLYLPLPDWDSIRLWHVVKHKVVSLSLCCHAPKTPALRAFPKDLPKLYAVAGASCVLLWLFEVVICSYWTQCMITEEKVEQHKS